MKKGVQTIIAGAVLLLLGGTVIPLAFVLPALTGESHRLVFKVPGTARTLVEQPGRYYLWNEFRTIFQGRSYNREEDLPDGMEFAIRGAGGERLELVSDGAFAFTIGNNSKRSIGYVEIEEPGEVNIAVSGGGGEERVMSFAEARFAKALGRVAVGIGVTLLVAAAGLGLLLWGIVRVVKARQGAVAAPRSV